MTLIITALITISILAYYLPQTQGIFFPQDEFGYWNNAARIIGLDWSQIADGQSSYAYGYSLFLVPLLVMFKSNPLLLYRAAIALNACLLIAYAEMLERLIKKIFLELNDVQITLLTLMCTFAPYVSGYVHYTMAEVLIHVLFVILLNIVWDIEKQGINGKRAMLGSLTSLFLLLVHYRTIGVLFSFIFILLACLYRNQKIKISKVSFLIAIICTMVNAVFFVTIKGYFSVKELLNLNNDIELIMGILGKIFYANVATMGLGCIGLIAMNKKRKSLFTWFYLSSFVVTCLISAYFFIGSIRFDQLIYGRYIEMFLPLLICYGFNELFEGNKNIRNTIVNAVIMMGVMAGTLSIYVSKKGFEEYLPNFVSGVDWMMGNKTISMMWLYIKPFYISVFTLALGYILMTKVHSREFMLITAIIVSIISLNIVLCKDVYKYHKNDQSDYEMSRQIQKLMENKGDIILLDSPYNNYVNLMQFWLMDKSIHLVQGLDPEAFETPDEAIIITHANYEAEEQLLERYSNSVYSSHFKLYYNKERKGEFR